MKTFIKHIHQKSRHWPKAGLALLMTLSVQITNAQTKNYLLGTKTGNFDNVALLGPGSSSVSAPMISNGSGIFFQFYYGTPSILTGTTSVPTKVTSARATVALGLTGADTYLQFRNTENKTIPAGTTSYIKLGDKPVNAGLNVNVGGLLGLEKLYNITGGAYKNAGDYSTSPNNERVGTPITNNAQTVTKLVIDKENKWTAAITPPATEAYNAVRLNVALPAGLNLVSLASVSTDVYNAYTISTGSACSTRPIFTGFGNTGVTLNAGSLIGGLDLSEIVRDAYKAIDDDATTFSSFNSGLASVGVASTVAQEFLFDHEATEDDAVKIHFTLGKGLLDLNLLSGGVSFKAYKGTSNTPVATQTLDDNLSLIGLNLADILVINGGFKDINTTFKPGVAFDRVEVSFNAGLVSVGLLADALRIYDVELSAPAPSISSTPPLAANNSLTVYQGQTIRTITATSAGNDVLWFLGNNTTPLTSGPSPVNFPVTSIATPASYVYYAASQRTGCTTLSAKVPVNITVLPLNQATLPAGQLATNYTSGTALATSTGRTLSFQIVGGTLPLGLTLNPTTGIITGNPGRSGSFTVSVKISDITVPASPLDAGTHSYTLNIATNLSIVGGAFPAGQKGSPYSQQLPAGLGAKLGIAPYAYALVAPSAGARVNGILAVPTGLTLSPAGLLSGIPTEIGSNTFAVQVTDSEGSTAQTNFTVLIETPLPVTLTSFKAAKEGQTTFLRWSTSAETNSDRFEIERSTNGRNWNKIGERKSNKESFVVRSYDFPDAEPLNGENLYRLKMIDLDGTFAYSRIESVTFEGLAASFYPNPVAEKLLINAAEFNTIKSIRIFDASGKTVYQSAIPAREINVQNLSSGLYIIQTVSKSGAVTTQKIIKQ